MSKRRSSSKSPPGVSNKADDAMVTESDGEDVIPSTQPVDDRVLKDVVAYVEVRSNTENRSASVSKQLQLLGATVESKFGATVTHVIWKEGKKSTKDKALKKGLHLVSVLWIDSCKQNQEHVAESLFPVYDPTDGSPLVMAKLKRIKSMQPKPLEEDMQDGALRKRRRKRKLVAEDFEPLCLKVASPNVLPPARILVEDTQSPRSPLIVGPNLTPTLSLIPNTPESMRKALDNLSKRKAGTPNKKIFSSADESPTSSSTSHMAQRLLTKQLFLSSAASSCSETDTNSTTQTRGHKSNDISDSSYTEKQQHPAKRQRLSSGQKDKGVSGSKRNHQRSSENEGTELLADLNVDVPRGGKIQGSRVADLSKVKKGRRSSMRVSRQSAESQEKIEGALDNSLSKEGAVVNERLTKVKSDSSKAKKGCRSSMRIPKQSLEDQTKGEEAGQSSVKTSNKKNMKNSDTDQTTQQESGTSIKVSAPSVAKKNRRKLMSLSSQCEPTEELIVPTQSSTKNGKSILSNDPNMFPSFEEEEGVSKKKNQRSGTQKKTSRKRKNLTSSPESENDPPEGSQNSCSSQNSTITLIPTSRRSLDEFKGQKSTRKKSQPASQAKKRKTSALSEFNSLSACDEENPVESQKSVTGSRGKRQNGRTRNASQLGSCTDSDSADSTLGNTKSQKRVRIARQSVRKSKKVKPTLVMTSMHASDQELVLSVAKALKHFKVIDTVCDTTTHIVCGDNRRTLNVLSGIARGCWLLSTQWVLNSVEAGYWLPEEPYELHDYFPAGQVSRLERHAAGDTYQQDLFAPPGSIYITEDSSPPYERLVELVELCGGQVAHKLRDATLCVGKVKQKVDVPAVTELWVLDCITQHCQVPLEPYFLDG